MASNHVPIDTTRRLGQKLRRLADLARELLNALAEAKAVMESQIDGSDYSAVEAQYGLPAGKGQTAYNLVAGARTAANVPAVNQLADWLG